LNSPIEK
jgi:hypothetical protein